MTWLLLSAALFLPVSRAGEDPVEKEIMALHELARAAFLEDHDVVAPRQVADHLEEKISELRRRLGMLDRFMTDHDPRRKRLQDIRGRLSALSQSKIEMKTRGRAEVKSDFDALWTSVVAFADLDARSLDWRQLPHGRVFETIGEQLANLMHARIIDGPTASAVVRVMHTITDFSRFVPEGLVRRDLRRVNGHLEDVVEAIGRNQDRVDGGVHRLLVAAIRDYLSVRTHLGLTEPNCAWSLDANASIAESAPTSK